MNYLNFDKKLLSNLERSLSKEMIRTNRAGAYNSTTLIDCNTRKYHGQLVLPLGAPLPEGNYVLLGSLDETVIQHGAEFNLGIHQYDENLYMPNGPIDASALAPVTSESAPRRMDLPAPVCPVIMIRPSGKSISRESINT